MCYNELSSVNIQSKYHLRLANSASRGNKKKKKRFQADLRSTVCVNEIKKSLGKPQKNIPELGKILRTDWRSIVDSAGISRVFFSTQLAAALGKETADTMMILIKKAKP